MIISKTKTCVRCKQEKQYDEMTKNQTNKDGMSSYCNKCNVERSTIYKINNKDNPKLIKTTKKSNRTQSLKKHNIDECEYDEVLKKQRGLCAICDNTNRVKDNRSLYLNINNSTGELRGLLCANCHLALNGFRNDINVIKKSVKYLEGEEQCQNMPMECSQ